MTPVYYTRILGLCMCACVCVRVSVCVCVDSSVCVSNAVTDLVVYSYDVS